MSRTLASQSDLVWCMRPACLILDRCARAACGTIRSGNARHAAALATLTVLAAILFLNQLDRRALWSSHEARAGQHAQLMLENGQWGMPRLYAGIADYQKPPLYYWVVASVTWLRGGPVDAWAVRLPAAAAGLIGVWLVYGLGTVLWRPTAGFVAALIVATNLRYAWLARVGRIDMPLGLAISLVLACFWLAYRRMAGLHPFSQPTRAWRWMLPCYLAAAAAVMLKGPVGLVLPAISIGLFLVLERYPVWPWQHGFGVFMHRLGVWWGFPLVLFVAGPWFVWATVATDGEFFRTFFLHHHLDRTFGTDGLKPEPIWYYIPRVFIDLFPWSLILPAAITAAVREAFGKTGTSSSSAAETPSRTAARYVLAWVAGMFVFLSLVRFKRHDYLLPLVPGLALLMAGYWDRLLAPGVGDAEWRWARRSSAAIVLSLACAAVAMFALRDPGAVSWLVNTSMVRRLLHETDRMLIEQLQRALSDFSPWAFAVATSVVLAGVLALLAVRGRRPVIAVTLFATAWAGAFWLCIDQVLPRLEPLREQRSIAQLARELRPPRDPLFYYGREDQQLMFYLGPHTRWLTNREALRSVIDQKDRPVFVVVELDRFLARQKEWPDVKMIPLAQNVDNPFGTHRDPAVLATNAAGWRLVQATRPGVVAGVGN